MTDDVKTLVRYINNTLIKYFINRNKCIVIKFINSITVKCIRHKRNCNDFFFFFPLVHKQAKLNKRKVAMKFEDWEKNMKNLGKR